MPRRLHALLALALVLALPAAARAQDPPPQAPALTTAQHTLLDATLSAMIATEGDHPTKALITAAETQCGSLAGTGDRVLVRFASLCAAQLRAVRAGLELETCDGRRACRAVFGDIRNALRNTTTAARRFNRMLRVALSDARCVQALDVSRGELRSLRRLDGAYELLSTAVRNRSERQLALAEKRFAQAGQPASAALVRRRLRAGCAPAG